MSRSNPVKVAPFIKCPKVFGGDGVFLNAFPFWRHLHVYDAVDATTFTFDPAAVATVPLRRVLFNRGDASSVTEMRRVANLHAKLFLCYEGKRFACAFAGSWNLVKPTWLEVVVRLPRAAAGTARDWFEEIWRQGEVANKPTAVRRRPLASVLWIDPAYDWEDEREF